ncbi:MAG: hypothetical protein WD825_09150 [Gemmatimonadaceae bacterium]
MNAFESGVLLHTLVRDGVQIDWRRTASSGAFVFLTEEKRIILDRDEVGGVASAPVIVIGAFSGDQSGTMRHETIHVLQQWFVQEAWGRPIEEFVRSKIPGARQIPDWLEVGVVAPSAIEIERWLTRGTGARRLQEAEAELFERR